MTWDRKIPFDQKGNMVDCDWGYNKNEPYIWKSADIEIEDTLEYVSYQRGRSSSVMWLKDSNGILYPMGHICFMKLIPRMINGKVKLKFSFFKRGSSFLIDEVS